MTGKPPDSLPDSRKRAQDGAMLPGQDAVEAWQRLYIEKRRRQRETDRWYRAGCARLRDRYGPPGTEQGTGMTWPREAWAQDPFDDAAVPADDEDDHRDRGDLPPCERTD